MVIVKAASETLGGAATTVAALNGLNPPVELNFSSRRDKRGMVVVCENP